MSLFNQKYLFIFLLTSLCLPAKAQQSEATHLESSAKSILWKRLLHYSDKAKKSDVVSKDFFLAKTGGVDPKAELLANIEAFKADNHNLSEEIRFACRFPARKKFIEQNFNLKSEVTCPAFNVWRERAEPEAIYMVFASQFIGNPASAFGHSLLRFDSKKRKGLLGYALTYSATVDPSHGGLEYALRGLLGGYQGEYQFESYYVKNHTYANNENRGLWEYELNLTKEEKERIFDHAWELSLAGQTKYYFFDRNCTYQLLSLIDVGSERFNLASTGDQFFLTPLETIKVLDRAGLIKNVNYRPSFQERALASYEGLSDDQKQAVSLTLSRQIIDNNIKDAQTSSVLVAALALDEMTKSDASPMFDKAIEARSKFGANNNVIKIQSAPRDPLQSHSTLQAKVGIGVESRSEYMQLGFRPALHALDDYSIGFLPNTQLVFLDTSVRISDDKKVRFNEVQFIDIKSLQPRHIINNKMSWSANLSYQQSYQEDCLTCMKLHSDILFGYSTEAIKKTLAYGLVGPSLDTLSVDDRIGVRVGPRAEVGVLSKLTSKFVFKLTQNFEYFVSGPYGSEAESASRVDLKWLFGRDKAISVKASHTRNLNDEVGKTSSDARIQYEEYFN